LLGRYVERQRELESISQPTNPPPLPVYNV